jgi:CheY-like chemotaxis protein
VNSAPKDPGNSRRRTAEREIVPIAGRVLLAEDNPVNREVALCMLKDLGCEADVAQNGVEALRAFSHASYDLILMDCQMPEMDGYTATKRIREREKTRGKGLDSERERAAIVPRIPIVALTAHAMEGDREECLAAGMDDYLSKPFNQGQLHTVLKRWLLSKPAPDLAGSAQPGGSDAETPHRCVEPLDREALDLLKSISGNGQPGLFAKVIRIYMQSSQKLMESLRKAISLGDASAMEYAAHSLKSASANLGGTALAKLCKKLEGLGRAGNAAAGASFGPALEIEYERVREALAEELEKTADLQSPAAPISKPEELAAYGK